MSVHKSGDLSPPRSLAGVCPMFGNCLDGRVLDLLPLADSAHFF
ncbi:MAG: hypothetical protein PHU14_05585 [Methylovulum sp.]|nr:hypothetical protein [Methylovulum sp.]